MRIWRKISTLGDRVVLTAAGFGVTLEGLDKPSTTFWDERQWLVAVSIGAMVAVGIVMPFQTFMTRRNPQDRALLYRRLVNTVNDIHEKTNIDLKDIGLHIWLPRRRWIVSGYLRRAFFLRVSSDVINQTFVFTKGKGVVGLCWKNNAEVRKDIEGELGAINTEAEWAALESAKGSDFVMNMSFTEFSKVRHRGAVIAVPLNPGGRFVGCISADSAGDFAALVTAVPLLNALALNLQPVPLENVE